MDTNRAFDFIQFPAEAPPHETLIGHDRLASDRYHGSLSLKLTALTPVFIAAGVTALGSDVGESVPLIKVMGQDSEGHPILQGTSLKGCIRSVYEVITNSTFGAAKKNNKKPENMTEKELTLFARTPIKARRRGRLSPAELVFGAMGFQGLISIADAVGDRPLEIGTLPAMYAPKVGKGRKFYRHQSTKSGEFASDNQPLDQRQEANLVTSPSSIHQAPKDTVFTTTLRFTNLTLAQLGALLITLGLDPQHRFALKIGAGKGKGLGSIVVNLESHAIAKGDTLKQTRYLNYAQSDDYLPDSSSTSAIQEALASDLIESDQLTRLQQILAHPEVSA